MEQMQCETTTKAQGMSDQAAPTSDSESEAILSVCAKIRDRLATHLAAQSEMRLPVDYPFKVHCPFLFSFLSPFRFFSPV